MWPLKTKTVTVMVGALGSDKKETQEKIKKIPDVTSHNEIRPIFFFSNRHSSYPAKGFAH